MLSSWYTDQSGQYARIYETDAAQIANTPVTTWSRGQGTQATPVYAGVHEIAYDTNWIYIRTSNTISHK